MDTSDLSTVVTITSLADTEGVVQMTDALTEMDAAGQAAQDTTTETAAATAAASDDMTAAAGELSEANEAAAASFTSLGASADEYSANMKIIAASIGAAEGDVVVATTDANGEIIDANEALILSYRDVAAAATESGATQDAAGAGADMARGAGMGGIAGALSNPYVLAGAAITAATALTVKAAGDFQKSVTQIYTTAGETAPLQTLDNGILQIARDTGTSTSQLTAGLYTVSSAGYNTAAGLQVLRVSAEAAKAENADLGTVTNAVTTIMHDYGLGTSQATNVTNAMIQAVSQGKMHLQDFASSLSTVLPLADSVHLSFAQVAGAEATLTAGGVSADQATQDLKSTISAIISPTSQQVTAMQAMGLSSVDLGKNIGKEGLTGTLQQMFNAIEQHMGPDGQVIQSAMKNSTLATQDMNTMLQQSPPALQSLEKELMNGSISFTDFRTQVQSLPEGLANMGKEFESVYNQTSSFNSQLTSAINNSPTFTSELKAMTGQQDAMNAVLMLTGDHQTTFENNVNSISKAMQKGGTDIAEWPAVLKNMDTQLDIAKENFATAGIAIGTKLLPAVTGAVKGFDEVGSAIGYGVSQASSGISKITGLGAAHAQTATLANDEATAESTLAKTNLTVAGAHDTATKAIKNYEAAAKSAKSADDAYKSAQDKNTAAQKALSKATDAVSAALAKSGPNSKAYNAAVEAQAKAVLNADNAEQALAKSKQSDESATSSLVKSLANLNSNYNIMQQNEGKLKSLGDELTTAKSAEEQAHEKVTSAVTIYNAALQMNKPNSQAVKQAAEQLGDAQLTLANKSANVKSVEDQITKTHQNVTNESKTLKTQLDDLGSGYAALAPRIEAATQAEKGFNNQGTSSGLMNELSHLFHFAGGVNNFQGGLAVVGEQGPELVYLPSGSSVVPNDKSQQMISNMGGGGGGNVTSTSSSTSQTTNHIQVNLTTAAAVSQFITQMDMDGISSSKGLTASRGVFA